MCVQFCPEGCPACCLLLLAGQYPVCQECKTAKNSFGSFVDPKSHATLAAPPAALQNEKSKQDPDYRLESGIFLPNSPALTEYSAFSTDGISSSMKTDWVSDIQKAFDDEMQFPESPVEPDQHLAVSQPAGIVSDCADANSENDVQDLGQASNEDLESGTMEQDSESDDTNDPSYLGVLRDLARYQRRATAIIELRAFLLKSIPHQQHSSSFLAQTPAISQEEPPQSQNKIEPSRERTSWTKSGRTFSSIDAARRASSSSSIANIQLTFERQIPQAGAGATISTTSDGQDGHSVEDMETESELSECDEGIFKIDMDDEMSDDDAESEYEPGTGLDDTSDMDVDVDLDEEADFEMRSVQWTEARALW
ncbi:hypothetical protein QFC20_002236 [Naganishia adeliensis]|uniref:Uncharacterized protein n=1 Tax=Naganishia adeliensis TaxID=92952 RepID=A0ACC2WL48_9TREE|nr:hypothetical protein QFC20_002236 [Naganishia adeliensis]